MWSVECKVSSLKSKFWRVKYQVWSVECKVWGVKSGV